MSYAIIRNEKYKRENLKVIYRHNERRNKNYSNKNINKEKLYLNYSLKDCKYSYEKEFDLLKEKYNLKGQVKVVSNIACSEFWKEKDSYKILQNNFYSYMVCNNFNLERGSENGRVHLSVEDYKKITDFEKTKVDIQDIELDLPEVPNIKDFNKLIIGRD